MRQSSARRIRKELWKHENMGVVMLECLSVCRCSLLVVHLTVMMDSRGTESGPGENVGLRQVYGSYTLSPYYCLRRVRVIASVSVRTRITKSSVYLEFESDGDRGDREHVGLITVSQFIKLCLFIKPVYRASFILSLSLCLSYCLSLFIPVLLSLCLPYLCLFTFLPCLLIHSREWEI